MATRDFDELRLRTKQFAIRVINLVEALPQRTASRVIGSQLVRSGTSVGANYRAACRARSRADFVSKLGIVEEEADESAYWIELLTEAGLMGEDKTDALRQEAEELTAIMSRSRKTARENGRAG